MQFLQELAADTADKFKDTAEAVWDALGGPVKKSERLKEAQYSAGKYALTASLCMMMNFPDNADVFRDIYNLNGKGHTGAFSFVDDEELHDIGKVLGRASNVATVNNYQARMAVGHADVSATSTLDDIQKMLPMLVAITEGKD